MALGADDPYMLHFRLIHSAVHHLGFDGPYGAAESAGMLEHFEDLIDEDAIPEFTIFDMRQRTHSTLSANVAAAHTKWLMALDFPPNKELIIILAKLDKKAGYLLRFFSYLVRNRVKVSYFKTSLEAGSYICEEALKKEIKLPDYWMFHPNQPANDSEKPSLLHPL